METGLLLRPHVPPALSPTPFTPKGVNDAQFPTVNGHRVPHPALGTPSTLPPTLVNTAFIKFPFLCSVWRTVFCWYLHCTSSGQSLWNAVCVYGCGSGNSEKLSTFPRSHCCVASSLSSWERIWDRCGMEPGCSTKGACKKGPLPPELGPSSGLDHLTRRNRMTARCQERKLKG